MWRVQFYNCYYALRINSFIDNSFLWFMIVRKFSQSRITSYHYDNFLVDRCIHNLRRAHTMECQVSNYPAHMVAHIHNPPHILKIKSCILKIISSMFESNLSFINNATLIFFWRYQDYQCIIDLFLICFLLVRWNKYGGQWWTLIE